MKTVKTTVLILFVFLSTACMKSRAPVPTGDGEELGISEKHLSLLDEVIRRAIDNKELPGAEILVGRKGHVVFRRAYGHSQWIPSKKPMEAGMVFDLASITKPVATATSIMILVERGRIRLWDNVKEYVPEFTAYTDETGKDGEDARLWHLLTHTSGLPPYTDAAEIKEKYGDPCPTETLVGHIAKLSKTDPPGRAFHYSCLGYITLAHIISKVTGQTVAEFSTEYIFRPLKMTQTFFRPSPKIRERCVPTEVFGKNPLRGVVHDPLARLQGGVSGNAGLFSSADDLAVFAQMLLNRGQFKGVRILSPLTVDRMTEIFPEARFAGRGLGWDLDSSFSTNGGDLFGPHSFGHTGYTGTSIWIDPDTETFLIFLTNRVHPDDKGEIVALRSKVANIVAASLDRAVTRRSARD